jgi:hypothetical protein
MNTSRRRRRRGGGERLIKDLKRQANSLSHGSEQASTQRRRSLINRSSLPLYLQSRTRREEEEEGEFFDHYKNDLERHAHTLSGVAGRDLQEGKSCPMGTRTPIALFANLPLWPTLGSTPSPKGSIGTCEMEIYWIRGRRASSLSLPPPRRGG